MAVSVQLLGTPKCSISGQPVNIPYKKAEALFYYLLVEKKVSKDELASLFWSDFPDDKARKNLRNSIYILKKTLNCDFIESSQSVVSLNASFIENCDMDINKKFDGEYPGDFMQGFFLKEGSESFESWMIAKRRWFRVRYREEILDLIQKAFDENKLNGVEKYAHFLIELDELDELPWRILMRYYLQTGSQYKAVRTYEKLAGILRRELEIEPSQETEELYSEVVESISTKQIDMSAQKIFYGRDLELKLIKSQFGRFVQSAPYCHILIQGEAGIGKTKLKEEFLKSRDDNVFLMSSQCYQLEKSLYLKPWSDIFREMAKIMEEEGLTPPNFWGHVVPYLTPDFSVVDVLDILRYQVAEEVVLEMLKTISKKKKILIVIEDLQWMDNISLSLLSSVVAHCGGNIFLLMTLRDEFDRSLDEMFSQWARLHCITRIDLERFAPQEVAEFMRITLPEVKNLPSLDTVYHETEGNAFFLVEYLNFIRKEELSLSESKGIVMTCGMKDILRSRLYDLSEKAREVLSICSIFYDRIFIDVIKKIVGSETELVDSLEELVAHGIIRQVSTDFRMYEFTHQKLRTFAYGELSPPRRAHFHEMAAEELESMMDPSNQHIIYPYLIYHYDNAHNLQKKLVYQIKNVKLYLDFYHEFFPALLERDDEKRYFMVPQEESIKQLREIELGLIQLRKDGLAADSVTQMEIECLHLKGRQLIRCGQYEKGIECAKEMISKALASGSHVCALDGYKQIIYYYRQIHDTLNMAFYIDEALDMAVKNGLKNQEGVLLRLKGLAHLMDENLTLAEKYLKESIEIFQELCKFNDTYVLNIAAAYNYLGDVRKNESNYAEALTYYEKAVDICNRKNVHYGLYMFCANVGQIYYLLGDHEKSMNYFRRAMEFFEQIDVTWGRSVAESYLALLIAQRGETRQALAYLEKAQRHAEMMNSPYEMKILEQNRKEIHRLIDSDKKEAAAN